MSQHEQVIQDAINLTKELINEGENGWTLFKEDKTAKLWQKVRPETKSKVACYKCIGDVKGTPSDLVNMFWSWNEAEWKKFASDLMFWKIVEDGDIRLIHQAHKLPWPLWSRDVCMVASKYEYDNCQGLIIVSVDDEKAPLDAKKYVRANVFISTFHFEMLDDETSRMYRILHTDPNGSIPAKIVNATSTSILEAVKMTDKALSK